VVASTFVAALAAMAATGLQAQPLLDG